MGVENDFTDEVYDSSWSYMKHVEKRHKLNGGHDHYTSDYSFKKDQVRY